LPLSIEPMPSQIVRVFVGRMEVITPADVSAVEEAIATSDRAALDARGRFLGPIGDRILARTVAADERTKILSLLNTTFKSYVDRSKACS
ncbi:MAG: hypothetical protein ACRD2A_21990, partial [Vicinamibacterales bacterium]